MRALITGADGFAGRYMAARLKAMGCEVHGLVRRESAHADVYALHHVDLLDSGSVGTLLTGLRPEWVVHLAAISFVTHGDVEAIYRTNIVGTRNLLQALVESGTTPQAVLLASSANIYGNAAVECIDENVPPAPANDYAVSKLAMEYMARLYADRLPLIIVRPFNYTGVRQPGNFLLPKIVSCFRKREPAIELGNLDVARDFSDVRMVTDCYRRLLQCPSAIGGVFNVCNGRTYALSEVLSMMQSLTGHAIEVRVNPALVRANEVRVLRGNRARLEAAIGPVNDIPLEQTLRWMLEDGA